MDPESAFPLDLALIFRNHGQAAGIAADQEDDGELAAKHRHLAVFDVAAVAGNEPGQLLHETDFIGADRCQNEMFLFCHRVNS